MAGWPRLRLRTRIVLLVLLGGVLPLAIWGQWILSNTERSGEDLLRERMRESLSEVARNVGLSWIGVRSVLVDLSESDAVHRALERSVAPVGPGGTADPASVPDPRSLMDRWGVLDGLVERVVLLDAQGRRLLEAERTAAPPGPVFILPAVRVPVRRPGAAEVVGELRVSLVASSLLPSDALARTVSGGVLAVLDRNGGGANLPLAMDAALLAEDRFLWGGQAWITERRALSEPAYTLAMASPLSPFTEPLARARDRAFAGLLLAMGVGGAIALLFSGRMASSLEALARAADRVSSGSLDVEVEPRGPDEVARVGRAFNHMTRSLRETMERAARQETLAEVGEFAASLAHEVRNPLTSVRLDLERTAEGLPQGSREARLVSHALSEVDRLDVSVTGALRLARSGRVERKPLDLRDPVDAAVASVRPLFDELGHTLGAPQAEASRDPMAAPILVLGDRGALRQVVFNLLENAAMAFDEPGRAGVRIGRDGGEAVVEVWDDGPGMTPDQLDRAAEVLFTTRPDGTGLGLPLARRIAEAHGGRLELESRPGVGTTARLRIPRAPAGIEEGVP